MQLAHPTAPPSASGDWSARNLVLIALLTVFAFSLMGYHPGLEDDAFYLAAVKRNLNPALFSYDSDFFRIQFQATIFDKLIAWSVRLTHLRTSWVVLLWQLTAIFFLLHGCWRIARRCFLRPEAHWAATALVAALLTLPVTGIAINLMDQYLHPRALASAAIVAAVVAILDRRLWLAAVLLVAAFSVHALMSVFGFSFCVVLDLTLRGVRLRQPSPVPVAAALLLPFGWMFAPATDAWRQAASTRGFYYLARWEWYEWLGLIGPIVLLFFFYRFLRNRAELTEDTKLLPLVSCLLVYGVFHTIVGLALMLPASLERIRPFEPMRYLHLLYLFFFLIAGGLLGQYVIRRRAYRWVFLLLPLCSGMYIAQRQMYPASPHLELPFVRSQNGWLRAFRWIRRNTPVDSIFALDPHYGTLPDEDYHGFRALAERSVLADYEKDGGMACRVPQLAPRWQKEVTALNGWRNFQTADFQRLNTDFGVTWIVLSREDAQYPAPDTQDMACLYTNQEVKVCRLLETARPSIAKDASVATRAIRVGSSRARADLHGPRKAF
jgi:hypothetical protein